MAYNPTLYNPYGTSYGPGFPQPAMPVQQQSYTQPTVNGTIEWVDGEVGAKAYQIPAGTTKPIALWDSNDTVIYLKSMNPMGMPNPLQKIHYTIEESVPKYIGQGGAQNHLASGDKEQPDMTQYVRKEDMQRMKDELMQTIRDMGANTPGKHSTKEG